MKYKGFFVSCIKLHKLHLKLLLFLSHKIVHLSDLTVLVRNRTKEIDKQ